MRPGRRAERRYDTPPEVRGGSGRREQPAAGRRARRGTSPPRHTLRPRLRHQRRGHHHRRLRDRGRVQSGPRPGDDGAHIRHDRAGDRGVAGRGRAALTSRQPGSPSAASTPSGASSQPSEARPDVRPARGARPTRYRGFWADTSATTPKWSDNLVPPSMLLITPNDSAAKSSLRAIWSMQLRP